MDKDLILAIEKLKEVRRKGWVDSGIKDAESVADHTCAVSLCVLFASFDIKKLDVRKALTMALIHDLAESIVGDITPHDGIDRKEKTRREADAFKKLIGSLSKKAQSELLRLWNELEEGKSPEARLVLQADTFDRLVQAKRYHANGHDVKRFFHAAAQLKGTCFEKLTR